MKKVLTAIALVAASMSVSFAQDKVVAPVAGAVEQNKPIYTFAEFSKAHPELKKFEQHPEFVFDSKITPEKLKEMDYFPDDKIPKTGKYDFYVYVKPKPMVNGVELLSKTIVVKKSDKSIVGFLAHYRGEENKKLLENGFNKGFGNPIVNFQQNTDQLIAWGVENKDKTKSVNPKEKINSIILAYNIYTGLGSLIWNSPSADFNK